MIITGRFEKDANFLTIFTETEMYQIARSTGDWSSVNIGDRMANGHVLTSDLFQTWKSECTVEGTFNLSEN